MDTQKLLEIAGLIPSHLKPNNIEDDKPHFTVSARTTESCWVTLIGSNYFFAMLNGLEIVRGLLDGYDGVSLLVERLEQDKDNDTVYHSTVLHSPPGF